MAVAERAERARSLEAERGDGVRQLLPVDVVARLGLGVLEHDVALLVDDDEAAGRAAPPDEVGHARVAEGVLGEEERRVYLISDMAIMRIQYPERKRASCPMIENCSVPRNSYRLFDGSWRMVLVASPACSTPKHASFITSTELASTSTSGFWAVTKHMLRPFHAGFFAASAESAAAKPKHVGHPMRWMT